ncbi:MAG: RNA polymerase sigma-70 factor [Saprospiraceae bacterium]|nr:RNA polymerase sigma-70 factor [Saprospiraceae bacterium]
MNNKEVNSGNVFFKIKNETHFKIIFEEYFSSLYYYAVRIIHDNQLAEDVVQEIFLDLWKKRDEVYINKIANYLYTAVRYRCMNHIRHKKVKVDFLEKRIREYEPQIDDSIIMIEEEMVREINNLINSMPEQRKNVFLHFLDGLSQDEIANELNISVNTVKTHKLKARQFLRDHLKNSLYLLLLIKFDAFF